MSPPSHIIVDLVTDFSGSTRAELIAEAQRRVNGNGNTSPTVLCTEQCELPNEPDSILNTATTVVSDKPIEAMFNAKCLLDEAGVWELLLVTGRSTKKYWENVLLHLFSPVHVWAVLGVELSCPSPGVWLTETSQVEAEVISFLKSLPSDGPVEILRPLTIPSDTFNAGYSTRRGGVSRYPTMASLNLVFSEKKVDSIAVVEENRRRLADAAGFDPKRLEWSRTEHDKHVWVVGKEPRPLKHDGLVTNTPGLTLAAAGADCCVILLADVRTGACGVVHAGWRGTLLRAVKATLSAMIDNFGTKPADVMASIGPSLEAACFDLPVLDLQRHDALDPSLTWPTERKQDWKHMDMVGANSLMLQSMGVLESNIDTSTAECTACRKDKYFSHRRDDAPFGNQWGFISCRQQPNQ